MIRRLGEGSELVLDARMGAYWIHDGFKVYLKVEPDIAAHRIFKEVEDGKRVEDGATSINQTILSIQKQSEATNQRYQRDYGVDITNTSSFDLVIDSSDKNPEEIAETVKSEYRKWLKQKGG